MKYVVACRGANCGARKEREPSHEIKDVERDRAGERFGRGVVFSDKALGNLGPLGRGRIIRNASHTVHLTDSTKRCRCHTAQYGKGDYDDQSL